MHMLKQGWRCKRFKRFFTAVKQLEGKYLVQNRTNGEIYESPQQLYMLVGLCLFQEYELTIAPAAALIESKSSSASINTQEEN
jgi:ribonucleotide reductase alpha subunit